MTLVSLFIYADVRRDVHSVLISPYNGPLLGVAFYYTHEVFSAVVLCCLVGYWLYFRFSRIEIDIPLRIAWHFFMGTLLILSFYLPMYYGAILRDAHYPIAKVSVKDGRRPACGLLVLQSEESILLWSTVGKSGQVMAIPLMGIVGVSLGPDQDMREVVSEAMDGKSILNCNQVADPAQLMQLK